MIGVIVGARADVFEDGQPVAIFALHSDDDQVQDAAELDGRDHPLVVLRPSCCLIVPARCALKYATLSNGRFCSIVTSCGERTTSNAFMVPWICGGSVEIAAKYSFSMNVGDQPVVT